MTWLAAISLLASIALMTGGAYRLGRDVERRRLRKVIQVMQDHQKTHHPYKED